MADGTRGGSSDATLDKIATDDLTSGTFSGMKGQVVKLGVGANGAMEQVDSTNPLPITNATQLPASLGQKAMAASLPVVVASDQSSLGVTGTVTATFSGSLPAGTNNIGDVDVLTVPAPLSTTGGGTQAAALRVTVASDSTGVVAVTDNSGSLTVDAPVGTPAFVRLSDGSAAQIGQKAMAASIPVVLSSDQSALSVTGTVTATFSGSLPAGTNNIGDVDVLTVPAPLSTTGGGTEATALRVTVASDSTGLLPVNTELPAAAALADGASATPTTVTVGVIPSLMNATTEDRARAVVNALDSTGTGIAASGIVAQLDDTSTGTVTENQFAPVRQSSRRALLTEGTGPTTATTAGTQVASSATSVTLLASNALRRGLSFYNNSTQACYVKFGATASATSFTKYMAPGADVEMFGLNLYAGIIDAIWVAANGNMQVTEW